MNMPGHERKKTVSLFYFTMSYVCMFILILVFAIVIYLGVIQIVTQQTKKTNNMLLDQLSVRVDNSFGEANQFAYITNNMSNIQQLMQYTPPLKAEDIMNIRTTTNELMSFQDTNKLFAGYRIYLNSSDMVLEMGNCFINTAQLYDYCVKYNDLSFDEWKEQILLSNQGTTLYPAGTALFSGKEGRYLLYVRSLITRSRFSARELFYLDANRLDDLLMSLQDFSSSQVLLLSKDGEILYSTMDAYPLPNASELSIWLQAKDQSELSWNDGKYFLLNRNLTSCNYFLVSITPFSVIYSKASSIIRSIVVFSILFILLGIIFTTICLRVNRKPLASALKVLMASQANDIKHTNGLSFFNQAVHQLISSQAQLKQRLDEQRVELRSAVVSSLEAGDTLDEQEIDLLLSHVGIEPDGNRFRGVYLHITDPTNTGFSSNELEREDFKRALIKEILKPFEPVISLLSLKDYSTFILLYMPGEKSSVSLSEFFGTIYNVCSNINGLNVVFYIGPECSKLCYLPHSLYAARQVMQQSGEQYDRYLNIIDEIPGKTNAYIYTDKHEQTLISLTMLGKEEEVCSLIKTIYEKNKEKQLSRFTWQLLFTRMVDTLNGLIGDDPLPDEMKYSLHKLQPDHFFKILQENYVHACKEYKILITNSANQKLESIKEYIRNYYNDPSLSLSTISSEFGITENYLSAFFREKAGMNLSTYIENLRLDKATELLQNSDLTIDMISKEVGYTTVQTFRRAFLRVKGVNPSSLRPL